MRFDVSLTTALLAALSPVALSAATVGSAEFVLTADASFTSEGVPTIADADTKAGVSNDPFFEVEALVSGFAPPVPGVPNSVGTGFASSAGDSEGNFGVGVNGFFLPTALPPHSMEASGTITVDLRNDFDEPLLAAIDLFIPAPTITVLGQVGDFFPVGADPQLDATATVSAQFISTITRVDGSVEETVVLDYGMTTARDGDGEFIVVPTADAQGLVVEEDLGFFSFTLDELTLTDFDVGTLAPGDSITYEFLYFASGGTGFGETGVFAAIGDPFDISAGGGSFAFSLGDAVVPPSPVPLPASLPLLAVGLVGLAWAGRRRGS